MRHALFAVSFVAFAAGCSWLANNRSDIGGLICEVLPVFGRVCASPSALPQIRADAQRLSLERDAGATPP
jgi:hypothetical protein